MKTLTQLREALLYAGLTPSEFRMCVPEIRKRNRDTLSWMQPVLFFVLLVLLVVAYIPGSGEANNKRLYAVFAALIGVQFLLLKGFTEKHPKLILVSAYIFMLTTYAFGIHQACYIGSECTSTPICVLMVIVPLIIIDRPMRLTLQTIIVEAILLSIVYDLRKRVIADPYVIVNSLTCSVLGICCSFSIQITMFSDIRNHLMLEVQRDTDVMTGARSRVAYIRDIEMMSADDKSAGIIFADVNGLKRTNDTYGHEAGDRLIRTAFSMLRAHFNEHTDGVYRIGGDEFVVITLGENEASFKKRFNNLVEDANRESMLSCGCIWTNCVTDPQTAIKEAEMSMYEAKEKYYREHPERDKRR